MSLNNRISSDSPLDSVSKFHRAEYSAITLFTRAGKASLIVGSSLADQAARMYDSCASKVGSLARLVGQQYGSNATNTVKMADSGSNYNGHDTGKEAKSESSSEAFFPKHHRICDKYAEQLEMGQSPEGVETLLVQLNEGEPSDIFEPIYLGGIPFRGARSGKGAAYIGTPGEIGTILSVIEERILYSDSYAHIGRGSIRTERKVMASGKSPFGSWEKVMKTYSAFPRNEDFIYFPEWKNTARKKKYEASRTISEN